MKRFWPFDDFQPLGLTDLLFSSICVGIVIWPPFFGMLQCGGCIARFLHPPSARFVIVLIVLLVATGAGIGFFCGLALVLGRYYRVPWLARWGPFLFAATLVGGESSWLPHGFAAEPILWREELARALSGILLSIPAAWAAIAIAVKSSGVHPYRGQLWNSTDTSFASLSESDAND